MVRAVMRHGEGCENKRQNEEYIRLNEPNEELEHHKEWQYYSGKVARKHGNDNKKYLTRESITEQTERKRRTA